MTRNERGTEEEERSLLIIVLLAFVILIIAMPILLFLSLDGGSEYAMSCSAYEPTAQEEWLRSDNITSYEDIPESKKENLSEDERERLKSLPSFWFDGDDYGNLSNAQKDAFERAINHTIRANRSEIISKRVFYRGKTYRCERNPITGA